MRGTGGRKDRDVREDQNDERVIGFMNKRVSRSMC